MIDSRTYRFIRHFWVASPSRTALMVALFIVSGVAEGVGLFTLLPLLEFAMGRGGGQASALTEFVTDLFNSIGLEPTLGSLLFLIVAALGLKAFFRWLATKQIGYTVAQVATELRLRMIRALLHAEWSFFASKPVGYFANAISSEASRASNAYLMVCKAMAGVIQIAIYLTVVVVLSWEVAVIAFLMAPVVTIALRGFVRMSRIAGDEQTRIMKELLGRLTSILPGIKPIKAMSREQNLIPFLEGETQAFNEARQRTILATESLRAFQEPVIVLVLAVGLYGAVALGQEAPAAVLIGAVLFYRVMTTVGNVQNEYQEATVHESAFWSLLETIEEAEAAEERFCRSHSRHVPGLEESLRFEDVSFRYDEGPFVLRSVNLEVLSGEMIAVSGPSGAGKTTLVDLVTGLLHPSEGEIRVDGVSLKSLHISEWRRQIGYVPQHVLLLNDSIYENVTLGESNYGRDEVVRALEMADAWDFVKRLAEMLETNVGEAGARLSGGQKQRIAIARALIGSPQLLILDEPTSALDPETEAAVCRTLVALRGSTTILAVSHQPALLAAADRVYRLADGRLSERTSSIGKLV